MPKSLGAAELLGADQEAGEEDRGEVTAVVPPGDIG